MVESIDTWDDLIEALQKLPPEVRKQPVQVLKGHPDDLHVHALKPGIAIGTIDEFEIRYARSAYDNRRHGSDLVLLLDGNLHGKSGVVAWKFTSGSRIPIHRAGHDESADWTGPAQRLADAATNAASCGDPPRHIAEAASRLASDFELPPKE